MKVLFWEEVRGCEYISEGRGEDVSTFLKGREEMWVHFWGEERECEYISESRGRDGRTFLRGREVRQVNVTISQPSSNCLMSSTNHIGQKSQWINEKVDMDVVWIEKTLD